jgi:RNA polymerase sigma factor (sigma-70 family)
MPDDAHSQTLLADLASGDERAFWELWQHHRAHLYGVCLRQMSGVTDDAADALSRSMLVALEKLPGYVSSIISVEAWLTRLTCNVCMDMYRERRRECVEIVRPSVEETPGEGWSPEEEAIASETFTRIATAIAELPPPLRDAARMRFLDEQSYEAMASRLSITYDNARKRVQQARAVLRDRLRTQEG